MLQFIPFEDDWDALELLRPEELIPYRVGLLPEPAKVPAVAFRELPVSDAVSNVPSAGN